MRLEVGRATDLGPEHALQLEAVDEPREEAVPGRQVGRRVEHGRARKEERVTRHEEQRLLAAHAPPDRVDALALDAKPRERVAHDPGHAGEVANLAGIAPGVEREAAALALRVHDGEAADGGVVLPHAHVGPGLHAAPVRRDDERDRRVAPRSVPARKDHERAAQPSVVRGVVDREHANLGTGRVCSCRVCRGALRCEDDRRRDRAQRSKTSRSAGSHAAMIAPAACTVAERDAWCPAMEEPR
jgi:hypothetical protein